MAASDEGSDVTRVSPRLCVRQQMRSVIPVSPDELLVSGSPNEVYDSGLRDRSATTTLCEL